MSSLSNGLILTLTAALLAFLYNVYLARVKEKLSFVNDCIQSIDRIEKLAVQYWLADGKETFQEELVAAAELRGALAVTSTFEDVFRDICGLRFAEYRRLDGGLFDAATGASFESAWRTADVSQTILVMQACHELRAFLRSERPRIYWAH